jgi:transposase InsO family protein
MNIHSRSRLTPVGRVHLVEAMESGAWSREQALDMGISERTAYKWKARFRAEGEAGLLDRSSRPTKIPRLTPRDRVQVILELRRYRMTGLEIARRLRMARSTVAAVLKREGLSRIKDLEPPPCVVRYERENPGELIHLDIKKLGRIERIGHRIHGNRGTRVRGAGWEFVHVAIDDASRVAYVEVLANEQATTTAGFLRRSLIFFRQHGIRKVQRVMTDNGSAYVSHLFAALCRARALRHIRTRPYRPCTNGKAERFIQTMLREWAYKRPYPSSKRRTAALAAWLRYYNHRRPHGALNGLSPRSRVA